MRLPAHYLKGIEHELEKAPDKTGQALLKEYHRALLCFDKCVTEFDFSPLIMSKVEECGRRLKNWYDAKVRQRTEYVKRKKDG